MDSIGDMVVIIKVLAAFKILSRLYYCQLDVIFSQIESSTSDLHCDIANAFKALSSSLCIYWH